MRKHGSEEYRCSLVTGKEINIVLISSRAMYTYLLCACARVHVHVYCMHMCVRAHVIMHIHVETRAGMLDVFLYRFMSYYLETGPLTKLAADCFG